MNTYQANRLSVGGSAVQPDRPISSLVVSWVLMIPLLCFACDGLFWFRTSANNALVARFGMLARQASADNTIVAVLLVCILPFVLLPRMRASIQSFREDKVFLMLAAWTTASCLWSQFPLVSLQWSPAAWLNILFAFYLYQRFSPDQQMRLMLLLGSLCLVVSIVLSLFFPTMGIDHTDLSGAWRGMYAQKNMCSMATAFLLPAALFAPVATLLDKCFRLVYITSSVFVIVMTQSVTGEIMVACLIAYILATKVVAILAPKEKMIAICAGALLAILSAPLLISQSGEIALALGKDPTLTGRTEIWLAALPSIMKHPILGYGYRAFWRGYDGESANVSLAANWSVTSAHNGFLEIWLTLGVVGLGLVVFSLLRASRNACICLHTDTDHSPYFRWCACIIWLTIILSLDEGEFVNPFGLLWLLYVLACIGLFQGAQKLRMGVAGD